MIRATLPVLFAAASCGATAAAAPAPLAERAVTCGLATEEIATLPARIAREVADASVAVRQNALPTGDLYRTAAPVSAFGYTTRDIYIAPARILLVVDRPVMAVAVDLGLHEVPYSPWTKPAGADRSIVAYELHQDGLTGRTLVGCEYRSPAVAGWFEVASP